jgi:hypothetical protein
MIPPNQSSAAVERVVRLIREHTPASYHFLEQADARAGLLSCETKTNSGGLLQAETTETLSAEQPSAYPCTKASLCMADVRHWMAPLWSEHYQSFRLFCLGLSAFPISDFDTTPTTVLSAPPFLYGISPLIFPMQGHWPASVTVTGLSSALPLINPHTVLHSSLSPAPLLALSCRLLVLGR